MSFTHLKPNAKFDHVFVVMREDTDPLAQSGGIEACIYITKIFYDEDDAKQEVARLNKLKRSKDDRYFYLLGRLERR